MSATLQTGVLSRNLECPNPNCRAKQFIKVRIPTAAVLAVYEPQIVQCIKCGAGIEVDEPVVIVGGAFPLGS